MHKNVNDWLKMFTRIVVMHQKDGSHVQADQGILWNMVPAPILKMDLNFMLKISKQEITFQHPKELKPDTSLPADAGNRGSGHVIVSVQASPGQTEPERA